LQEIRYQLQQKEQQLLQQILWQKQQGQNGNNNSQLENVVHLQLQSPTQHQLQFNSNGEQINNYEEQQNYARDTDTNTQYNPHETHRTISNKRKHIAGPPNQRKKQKTYNFSDREVSISPHTPINSNVSGVLDLDDIIIIDSS